MQNWAQWLGAATAGGKQLEERKPAPACRVHKHTSTQTDKQTNRQTDKQTGTQSDNHTIKKSHKHTSIKLHESIDGI